MSKWLKKDSYEMFANKKANETDDDNTGGGFYKKWKNPKMGTTERAKEYKVRLLPDVVDGFYKDYLYHGFMSGETFKYFLCEKTYGMDKYCPWCEATKMLYQGNESDKRKAGDYKRKQRFVSNVYISDDPRDAEVRDENYKVNGTIRLYEFPGTVESKIKNEITDTDEGYGMAIFDPENGYDFILKIKAKPKDKNGKEWPDYGDSMFSRNTSPIGETEGDIERLMNDRYNLDEYIESLRMSVEDHEKLLKTEMLWDDVGHTFEKFWKGKEETQERVDPVAAIDGNDTPSGGQDTQTDTGEQGGNQDDTPTQEASGGSDGSGDDTDALLAELQDM